MINRLSALVLLLAAAACAGGWEEPGEVRAAMLQAGILGQPPDEVERRLRALRFKDGRRLEFDSFNPRFAELAGTLGDSLGQRRTDWNVHVRVQFDSAGRAVAVDAYDSAVNPL